MANDKPTPDQSAAERIGRAIDEQIATLGIERETLLLAAQRIAEIDATLAVLVTEKAKYEGRRPPKPAPAIDAGGGPKVGS